MEQIWSLLEGKSRFIQVHAVAASLALVMGPIILLRVKGTGLHKLFGYLFVIAMLTTTLSGFFIYELTGGPSFFHVLGIVSTVTVTLGVRAILRAKKDGAAAIDAHYMWMTWAYAGLVMAGLAQLVSSVPDIYLAFRDLGLSYWSIFGLFVGSVSLVAMILIYSWRGTMRRRYGGD